MLMRSSERGETIIEVLMAFVVFVILAIGVMSLMGVGTTAAQLSLETTFTRKTVNGQAEALRYLREVYSAHPAGTGAAAAMRDIIDNRLVDEPTAINVETCTEAAGIPAGAFALDPTRGETNSNWAIAVRPMSHASAPAYPQIMTTGGSTFSYGVWIQAVRGQSLTADALPGYIDFHIHACWNNPSGPVPATTGTIVRLYMPGVTAAGDGSVAPTTPIVGSMTCYETHPPARAWTSPVTGAATYRVTTNAATSSTRTTPFSGQILDADLGPSWTTLNATAYNSAGDLIAAGSCINGPPPPTTSSLTVVVKKIPQLYPNGSTSNPTPPCTNAATLDRSGSRVTLGATTQFTNSASSTTFAGLSPNTLYNLNLVPPAGYRLCPGSTTSANTTATTGVAGSTTPVNTHTIRPVCTSYSAYVSSSWQKHAYKGQRLYGWNANGVYSGVDWGVPYIWIEYTGYSPWAGAYLYNVWEAHWVDHYETRWTCP